MCSLLLLLVLVSPTGVFSFFNDGQQPKAEQEAVQSPTPAAVESDPEAWKEFSNEAGRFRIMFPGNPVEADNSADSLTGRRFSLDTTAHYYVGYQDLSASVASEFTKTVEMQNLLFARARDGLRDGIQRRFKVEIVEDVPIALKGHHGRFIKLKVEDGGVVRQRMYLVANRLYRVMVINPKETLATDGGKFDQMRATKFLDSFTLTVDSEPRPPELKQ